jgi:hypothetical protein
VEDVSNWSLHYDRRLFREIRTISGVVMIMTVSAVGSDLIFQGEPSDGALISNVDRKLYLEVEMNEIVYAEGWPIVLLQYSERYHLAHKLLDKMKVHQLDNNIYM